MLLLILIAILSLVEGINVYKGILFSSYLIDFGRRIQGLLLITITSLFPALFIFFSYYPDNRSELFIIGLILVLSYLPKIVLWKYYHYSGNYFPSLINAIKWYFINYIIKMDFIIPMYVSMLGIKYLLFFTLVGVIVRGIMLVVIKNFKWLFLKIMRFNLSQVENISSIIILIVLLYSLT